ncbi:penicillin acylase family protein [Cellulomonas sp. P5_C6]
MTVFRDALGVPHVRAADVLGLAREQGLVTARDRGWQIEVDRWKAEGRLAERIGPDGVAWDLFARRARLADTAQRAYAALGDEDRAFVDAYVEGVNEVLADEPAERLALDARFGSVTPHEPWPSWVPLGIMHVKHALFSTFPRLVWNEHVRATLGEPAIDLFDSDGTASSGSNAWALHGSRTLSGKPLLAGDPHRMIELPGVYQQVRLACDDFDVLGLAFPGVPGVQHFGHTGSAAWGITNAIAHHVEVFRERLSDDGRAALGPDGWAPVSRHTETVRVRGAADVPVEVVETERGPVVLDGLSVRFPARVASDVGFSCLLPLLRARTADDVATALAGWVDPVNRVLAADAGGVVLSLDAGLVVTRSWDDRRLPHDAWSDAARPAPWHRLAEPSPVRDVAVDANERPAAASRDLGRAYVAPYRARRIRALLDADVDRPRAPADMSAIHGDTLLGSADELLGWVRRADDLSPAAAELRRRLLAWDGHMSADSVDAGAFAAWRSRAAVLVAAHPALARLHEPHGRGALFDPWLTVAGRVGDALPQLLAAAPFGIDGVAVAREALEGVAELADEAWGERHRLQPVPVMLGFPGPAVDAVPLSGDTDCVRCTASVPGVSDASWRGSVARWVWDLDDRSRSRWGVPFGASGDPASPHATDQLATWASAQTVEIVTAWDRLEEEPG